MVDLQTLKSKSERGFLDGQFLIAMPGMADSNFNRSVVYVCAHSSEGAMGFVINQPQQLSFVDILRHLKIVEDEDAILLPDATSRSRRADRSNPAAASCCTPTIT